jgi:hypothetical protein
MTSVSPDLSPSCGDNKEASACHHGTSVVGFIVLRVREEIEVASMPDTRGVP